MLTILAPTDFSANSRAGMRFALQWSSQQKLEIRFVHFYHTIRRPEWTDQAFEEQIKKDAVLFKNKLERFVRVLLKSVNTKPYKYSCIASYGLSADVGIMDYCRDHQEIDYICIANRGSGKMNKLLGTTSGNLTIRSRVPVITVPESYRIRPLNNVLFATDFANYTAELKKVISFARPLKAKIKILHLSSPGEKVPEGILRKNKMEGRLHYESDLQIKKRKSSQPILEDLQNQIYKLRPSLVVMFTNQHRNFFQKILFPSKTERLSIRTIYPLLSYNKL
jgi:hypothetical protein